MKDVVREDDDEEEILEELSENDDDDNERNGKNIKKNSEKQKIFNSTRSDE